MITINPWKKKKIFNLSKEKYGPNITYNYTNKIFDDSESPIFINDLRKAAECHMAVRQFIQGLVKPGMKLYDICNLVENKIIELLGCPENKLGCGVAFPTGVSVNNIIAHDTANPDDARILLSDDVCKLDIGIHINGRIIDSAFTIAFNEKYKNLLLATKEATLKAISLAGPDMLCNEISKEIKEVIESYQVELNGKMIDIKAIDELGGHTIDKYNIHSGKLLLSGPSDHPLYRNMRMSEGEEWAIETFASTGTGTCKFSLEKDVNHYMLNPYNSKTFTNFKLKTTPCVYKWINNNRGSLPFTQRWMVKDKNVDSKYKIGLKELLDNKIIVADAVLSDVKGCYTSQSEHTIFLHKGGKEVLTMGDDF